MKNNTGPKHSTEDPKQLDATELKRRAEEDAVRDADSYASARRPRPKQSSPAKDLDTRTCVQTAQHSPGREVQQEGIDGLLIHSNEGGSRLVLSEEILEISLADEVAALMVDPIKIFHIKAPAPWVEEVRAGRA